MCDTAHLGFFSQAGSSGMKATLNDVSSSLLQEESLQAKVSQQD